ncbi:MAG: hypothetical protein HRU15_11575, partial [Planctomycetes bacterium]|nr:hypothetical protein [Planctomycetota bacterium]
MKKVILHIGHAKTATTSIQETLKENRLILADNGYLYQLMGDGSHIKNHNKLLVTLFKNKETLSKKIVFEMGIDPNNINELRRHNGAWFGKKLQRSDAHTFIISGEYLPNFTEDELESIKQYFCTYLGDVEFEVFMSTRAPLSFARSSHQQHFKRATEVNIFYTPYRKIVSAFMRVFGRARINIYKFEDACAHTGGPVRFFFEQIGVSEEVMNQMEICRANESMSDVAADVLFYINSKIPFTVENVKAGLRMRGDHNRLVRLPGRKLELSSDYAV